LRILLLSDTHVGDKAKSLPSVLLNKIHKENPDFILHAGDITSPSVLEILETIAPVVAVRGNMDPPLVPEEEVVEVDDLRVGLIHGHQFFVLNSHFLTLKALDMDVDVLVFGHTHRFYHEVTSFHGREIHIINPGSPLFPRYDEPSFAVLRTGEEISVKRVKIW